MRYNLRMDPVWDNKLGSASEEAWIGYCHHHRNKLPFYRLPSRQKPPQAGVHHIKIGQGQEAVFPFYWFIIKKKKKKKRTTPITTTGEVSGGEQVLQCEWKGDPGTLFGWHGVARRPWPGPLLLAGVCGIIRLNQETPYIKAEGSRS